MDTKTIIESANRRRQKMKYLEREVDWTALVGKKVLDVGAAYGIWSVKAAQAGAEVIATGRTNGRWEARFQAYCKHEGHEIQYLVWDIQKYRNRKADVVFFFAVLHHVKDPKKALDNVFRVAKEKIWMEVATASPASDHKEYYYPTIEELKKEIADRGGFVRKVVPAPRGKSPRVVVEIDV